MSEAPVDFRLLARLGVPTRSFKAGEIVFREGDRAEELYIVQSGCVRVERSNRVLETLGPNSIFGEMALIDAAPRNGTAIAAADVTLVPIPEKQFLFLVGETPFFALNVMRVLARRLRMSNDAYKGASAPGYRRSATWAQKAHGLDQ
jgi:CRP/FNR family cyclic AMP-dependent transcriptional regulator